jgi:K+-transporting ATPase A subunit
MAVDQGAGNWEGKEMRFGIANSALFRNRHHGHFVRRGQFDAR